MFDMLDAALPTRGCNHTLRLVRAWVIKNRLPFDAVEQWCHDKGGRCDCEVMANCEQCFDDAISDVDW